jgi:hypothetical protein
LVIQSADIEALAREVTARKRELHAALESMRASMKGAGQAAIMRLLLMSRLLNLAHLFERPLSDGRGVKEWLERCYR